MKTQFNRCIRLVERVFVPVSFDEAFPDKEIQIFSEY